MRAKRNESRTDIASKPLRAVLSDKEIEGAPFPLAHMERSSGVGWRGWLGSASKLTSKDSCGREKPHRE